VREGEQVETDVAGFDPISGTLKSELLNVLFLFMGGQYETDHSGSAGSADRRIL
jgi:hypothetical protein